MEKLINLTPHPIVFADRRTLPKCDDPPRLMEIVDPAKEYDDIAIVRKTFDIGGCILPPQTEGNMFIVPLLILVTDDPIRDEQGRIIGCRRLASLNL